MSQLKSITNSEAVRTEIASVLKAGGDFTIPGLGKFSAKTRPARTGRNPATGQPVSIPEKKVVHFSAAKAIKDALNT